MNWGIVDGWAIETYYDGYGYWLGKARKGDNELVIVRRDEKKARDTIIALLRAGKK